MISFSLSDELGAGPQLNPPTFKVCKTIVDSGGNGYYLLFPRADFGNDLRLLQVGYRVRVWKAQGEKLLFRDK